MPLLASQGFVPTLSGGTVDVGTPTATPGASDTRVLPHNLKALMLVVPGGAYVGHRFAAHEAAAAVPAALSVNLEARAGHIAGGEFTASVEGGTLHIVRLGDAPDLGGGIV